MQSARSPKSTSPTPLSTPSPTRRSARPMTAGTARSMPTPTAGPRTPLRRPVSAVGKAMRKHLNDLWDDPQTKPRSRSPSPSRIMARLEAEKEAAALQAGLDVDRTLFCTLEGHSQPIRSVCLGPGNSVIYTAGMDGTIKVWEVDYLLSTQGGECSPQPPIHTLQGHTSGVSCLTLVDDRYLCSGGWDSDVRVWDVEDEYRCIETLKGHAEFVRAVVGADGLVFSGSNDRTIKVWDLNELQCVGMMTGHSLAVLCLAVAKDRLFSGGYDFMVKVWDIPTRQCIADLGGHTQVITSLSLFTRYKFSENADEGVVADSHTLYSCAEDMTVRVWDVRSLSCVGEASLEVPAGAAATGQPLPSTECRPWVSCMSNDGWLYIGSREGAVLVWDIVEGRCLAACAGHSLSVRSVALLHVVPYAESMLLSASDDGTVRVWKNKNLVKREKEGIRLEQERVAKEEALAKRRAKESLEMERQRQREELQRVKDQENEVLARQQLICQDALGPVKGTDVFTDLPYFEGWLLHKSYLQELTVWSMGHVHGIQVTYTREGKKGCKADKHAFDLGKQMPTANVRALEEGEEITEVSMIVSEKLVQGVVGQIKIKTTENGADGYKFGRTTDGEELRIVTPPGMRLACFTGSCSQKGLHQLGAVFVPKMERGRQQGDGRPLTLCARARISLATPDGRPLLLSDGGVLAVAQAPGRLERGTVFTLEGDNDEFALSHAKGRYLSLKDKGVVAEEWSARDGFSRRELFEIAAHDTDEGARVSIRAANNKLLAVRGGSSEVRAESLQAVEEEMLCVVARNSDDVEGLGPTSRVRFGLRTAEEKEAGWALEQAERRQAATARQLKVLLAEAGAHRGQGLAAQLFDRSNVRVLMDLPRVLREVGETAQLARLMHNAHFWCCKVATCGVGALLGDLGAAEKVLDAGHRRDHSKGRAEAKRKGAGSVAESAAIVKSLKEALTTHAAALESDPTSLFPVLCNSLDSLAAPLKAEVTRMKHEAEAALTRAGDSAQTAKMDLVQLVATAEQLEMLSASGVTTGTEGGQKKCKEVMQQVQDKVARMAGDNDRAISDFCREHMPSQAKHCSSHTFGRLAHAMNAARAEDVSEAYLRVRGPKEEGQNEQAVKDAMIAAVSNPPLPDGVAVTVAHFDSNTSTALLRFSRQRQGGMAGHATPPPPGDGAQSPELEERGRTADGEERGSADGGSRAQSPERPSAGESGGATQRTDVSGAKSSRDTDRGGKSPHGRRRNRQNLQVLPRSDSGLMSSTDKSVITLRDEAMARIQAGGMAPAIAALVPEPPQLKPCKLFVAGSGQDVIAERAVLHNLVLPALRSRARRAGVDLSWVDMQWPADDGVELQECSAHRALMALRRCLLPGPDALSETRQLAVLLLGQGSDREITPKELQVLQMREPAIAEPMTGVPMTMLEFLLRQVKVGVMEREPVPTDEFADAVGEEKKDDVVSAKRVLMDAVCFLRDNATIESEEFRRKVPGAVQTLYGVAAEREGKEEREAMRSRVELMLRMAEEMTPAVLRRFKMSLQAVELAPLAKMPADGVMWDTVSVSGLSEPPEQAEDEEMWGVKVQQLLDQMTFELPSKFTPNDIDPNFSFLSNRGSNAVVTYKGPRAQLAAALATQKHQIRMASNVRVVMKGPGVPGAGQQRALCDDKDMTLVEVKGIPKGTKEDEVFRVLSVALKEVTVHAGTQDEGELSGYVGVTYESSEAAADVRAKLSGVPFKYLRAGRNDDVPLGGLMTIERHESDPTGYLKVSGLPHNVDMEAVQHLFNVVPVPEWSTLRKDRTSAVLAFRHRLAASLIVYRFDHSRPWGGTGDKLAVSLVDPATALNRVFLSNVPLTLNDKIAGEWEKALKDLLSKEKDLFHAMAALPAKPLPAHTRVYSRHVGDSGDPRMTFAGDARIGYVHASLGKLALSALQREENSLQSYGGSVQTSLAQSPAALSAALRFSSPDLVRLALRAYKVVMGAVHRYYPEYPAGPQDLHAVAARDQELMEQAVLRESCVSGYSMSAAQLAQLDGFLTEMCALFRGNESEWLLIDELKRHELRHLGDGVRNFACTLAINAVAEKKGTIVVVYGEAGAGTTSIVARVAHILKRKADKDNQDEKAKAAAAAKTKTKKKVPPRPAATAVAGGAAKKEEGAAKKKEEKKAPEVTPSTVVVSYYKRPWGSMAALCHFVIREVWRGYRLKDEQGRSLNRDAEWARAAVSDPDGKELSFLRQALIALLTANLNVTVGLVLDGLSEQELKMVGALMLSIKAEVKPFQYKLWCVASMTVSVEDPDIDDMFFPVKLLPLTKAEATSILYDSVTEFGPHLLRKHVRLFMGMFKSQCWHPRYLRMLALFVCHQNVFFRLTHDINAIQHTLPALFALDVLPWLEREFNASARQFEPPRLPPRKEPPAAHSRAPSPHSAVEHVLQLLLAAGDEGVYVSDLPALTELPARVLDPLLAAVLPMLAGGFCHGRQRVALTCPALREAVTVRYWPSGLFLRGTGCTQLTHPLPPTHSPLRAAFGKQLGSFPVVIIDVANAYRLDTVKRLLTRLLAEMVTQRSKDGAARSFNFLSCSAEASSFAESMVEVDPGGNSAQAAAQWLAGLAPGGNRLEWTAAFELVGSAGFGHDSIFLFSDRSPTLSVERILDEVRHLESELGHDAEVVIHCNAVDAEPAADKMLRRVASETGGRFGRLSAFVMRQQLLSEAAGSRAKALEEAAGCGDPGLLCPVKALMASGASDGVMLEPPRAVSVLLRGEAEERLGAAAATARGLSLMVLSRDLSEKHNRTYDTWGSADETAALAGVLQGLTTNETVVLTSFDAWERCFDHQAANALSRCGIDGRRMLKMCEDAKASWDALCKKVAPGEPSDDARPEGHGHAVAAIGIPGRKPWGKTVLARDLGAHSPTAEMELTLSEISEARRRVEAKESDSDTQGRIVGVCKVVTPFRWSHQAGAGQGYNILPGHSYAVPRQDGDDRSLSSVLAAPGPGPPQPGT